MKTLIALTLWGASFAQPATPAPQPQPFVFWNVMDVHAMQARFGLPYPPNASDFIQVFVCNYEPGTRLDITAVYVDSGVLSYHKETQTMGPYCAQVVTLVKKAADATLYRVAVNGSELWKAKALRGFER